MTAIMFEVPGEPQGKARPRFRVGTTKAGLRFVNVYTPKKTMTYENLITHYAKLAMGCAGAFMCPIELNITAVMSVPVSWSIKKRNAALVEDIRPTVKPDFDNIEKVVSDALKGIVWRDDSQVVVSHFRKKYGKAPCLLVQVHTLEPTLLPGLL